ncbi:MAG TPA: SAM-dependent chlorinase/fluorinase [Burkholderiales bacterium]|nr:SAM-dependent chlorinase/fluorinase [Burkholderiales bacterium]
MIILFTDFGSSDPYLGQVKAVLQHGAPRTPVVDALNDAPAFEIESAAHLLAALAPYYPRGSVFLAVIDPGVGGPRDAVVMEADGRRFVGPDNGLLSVLWRRAKYRRCRRIAWRPASLSSSFHGRDLFAPVAAALARGRVPAGWLAAPRAPRVLLDAADLAQVIYVDHYGNAMTGLRAAYVALGARLRAGGRVLARAQTFSVLRRGAAFWYENSLGLVEIAANRASAARKLGLRVGSRVAVSRR